VRAAIVAVALFAVSAAIGSWYVPYVVAHGGKPQFYQEQFGPAVMVACGRGYVNPDPARSPALDAFLNLKADAVPCSEVARVGALPLTSMQRAFRYLMSTVGWTWRTEGRIAWTGLTPLYGALYGATVVLAFAVFLQGMSLPVAAIAAAALAISPLNMAYLAHLRDYAKAPFVLAIVLLAVLFVRGPVTTKRWLMLAAVAGLTTGIGVGFRNDLLVAVPAFVVLLFLFAPIGVRDRLGLKSAAAALYLAAFLAALSPMLTIYQTGGGNSSQHLVLLGLGDRFTDDLGIDNGDLYGWGYDYKDELAHAMINGYADRRLGEHRYLPMYGAEYDRAASSYLREIAVNFPADMLLRVYASTLKILTLPYSGTAVQQLAFLEPSTLATLYNARTRLLRETAPLWPWMIVFALGALTVQQPALGLFAAAMVLYLSGYPSLQFHERHYFHLEFIGIWACGFCVSQLMRMLAALRSPERRASWASAVRPVTGWPRALGGAVVIWIIIGITLLSPLALLRAYQQRHLRALFEAYMAAPREPLPPTRASDDAGKVLFDGPAQLRGQATATDDAVHSEYIVAGFGGPGCKVARMEVTFRYSATEPQHDFSRTIVVQPPAMETTRVFFPAYYHRPRTDESVHSGYSLAGVEVPEAAADCVAALERVRDARPLPVMMNLRLPPLWRDATLYGTLTGFEKRSNGDESAPIYTFPTDLLVRRSVMTVSSQLLDRADVIKESGRVESDGRSWHLSGVGGRGRFLHLAEWKPRLVPKGATLVASGDLMRGGISVGLVREGAWAAQVPVIVPGRFAVAIQTPDAGEYAVVMTNYVLGASLRYDVVVDRAGWVIE
jgi:hypothetical protein